MHPTQVAIYARASSEQQAETQTIASQMTALRERVVTDGLTVSVAMRFLDEGYSGATLVRPALEPLRDIVAAGSVDRLYVHSPDRLTRRYAYQVLLVDEFRCAGVEVIFSNRPLGQSPEDDLLLQVQGMIAEYERAKIIERHRSGKRHAARIGAVHVLSGAPYGYRYVTKYEGGARPIRMKLSSGNCCKFNGFMLLSQALSQGLRGCSSFSRCLDCQTLSGSTGALQKAVQVKLGLKDRLHPTLC